MGEESIGHVILEELRKAKRDAGPIVKLTNDEMVAVIERTLERKRWRKPIARDENGRNPLFDALCEGCGMNLEEVTKPMASAVGKALRDLQSIDPNVEADEISARCATFRRKYPGTSFTPSAIAKHWCTLGSERVKRQTEFCDEPPGWRQYIERKYPIEPDSERTRYELGAWFGVPAWLKQEIYQALRVST